MAKTTVKDLAADLNLPVETLLSQLKEAGLSHSTVTNMFNRSNAPTLPTLEAVCRAFGITLSQFFEDFEDNETLQEQRLLFSKWSTFTQEQRKILLDLMDIIK